MHYYESEKVIKKKGSIDLESCEELLDRLENKIYPYLFSLRTRDHGNIRTYFMAADTETEMEEWVNQLSYILDFCSKCISCFAHICKYTVSQKKEDTKLWAVTLSNLNRFEIFFH